MSENVLQIFSEVTERSTRHKRAKIFTWNRVLERQKNFFSSLFALCVYLRVTFQT